MNNNYNNINNIIVNKIKIITKEYTIKHKDPVGYI